MPRDLFGDVTRPSISIGNRKWYTVPVSLLSHSLIITMFVVLPILASPYLPHVLDTDDTEYLIDVLPPPPAPPKPRIAETKPIENPNAAPVVPPDGIKPESPIDLTPVETTAVGVIGGAENIEAVLVAPPPPVAKPAQQEPLRIGSTIRQPRKIRNVEPVYPQLALLSRVQGIVIIEATIGADGRVMNARVLRAEPLLKQAALDAVNQWEFTPTLLNGVAVPVIMTVTVMFTLK
jgi:periplasmic protein TonB